MQNSPIELGFQAQPDWAAAFVREEVEQLDRPFPHKVWFLTGTSRGFGRVWAEAALKRGDKVAATARDVGDLAHLVARYGDSVLPMELDVTDRARVFAAVQKAHAHFGRLDVVVNNAGYGHFGFIEEISESEARAQLETNLFGALWVTQAAVPLLREQGSGHILQISGLSGVAAFAGLGIYHASKWALEGFSEALAQEVMPFGIKVTLIEPGSYGTEWGTTSAEHSAPNPAYEAFREARAMMTASYQPPDPDASTAAVFAVVDSDNPPLRLLLTSQAYAIARAVYALREKTWSDWEATSLSGDGA